MTSHSTASAADYARQSAVLTLAIFYPLSNALPNILGFGRQVGDQSAAGPDLLVPYELAFSIWGPIFLGTLVAAVIQALPSRRTMAIHRRTGWWWAAAMALSCAWSIAESFSPLALRGWLTAFIFTPYVIAICVAMRRFSLEARGHDLAERFCSAAIALYAGWTSLAVFINWDRIVTEELGLLTPTANAVALLAAAAGWICWNLYKARGNAFYVFPAVWGLGLLAYDRLATTDRSQVIASAAIIGIALILIAHVGARKQRRAN